MRRGTLLLEAGVVLLLTAGVGLLVGGAIITNSGGCSSILQDLEDGKHVSDVDYDRCVNQMATNLQIAGAGASFVPTGANDIIFTGPMADVVERASRDRPTEDAPLPDDITGGGGGGTTTAACPPCPDLANLDQCPSPLPLEDNAGTPLPWPSVWFATGFGYGNGRTACDEACVYGLSCEYTTATTTFLEFELAYEPPGSGDHEHPRWFSCTEPRGFSDPKEPWVYYSDTHRAAVYWLDLSNGYNDEVISEELLIYYVEAVAEPCP